MNKKAITEHILQTVWESEQALSMIDEEYFRSNSERLKSNLARIGRASAGSWLGYHARVYYRNFEQPIPGDHFSVEWGLQPNYFGCVTSDNWVEYSPEQVREAVYSGIDPQYLARLQAISDSAKSVLRDKYDTVVTITDALASQDKTGTIARTRERLSKVMLEVTIGDVVESVRPHGSVVSRDSGAISQGIFVPPHVSAQAEHVALGNPFLALGEVVQSANGLIKYLQINDLFESSASGTGNRVFIGHGGSPAWRELKDFIHDRLKLEWEEFNREPSAGISTSERLLQMLYNSCFAFIVMTGEDKHEDGSYHARESVVHEVGLFQGKLGLRRAIILLESDCKEFSNIVGLGQIRFPKGNIGSAFEDIRRVLEREGIK